MRPNSPHDFYAQNNTAQLWSLDPVALDDDRLRYLPPNMSGDANVRRLLPQNSQIQSFSFAPNSFGPRENQKNYVFVDEHNRHKRLKVMRACEGCRRRKIKCDAATTNTWPCSACIRLKLHCVPPTVNYDPDFNGGNQSFDGERAAGYESGNEHDDYHNQMPLQQHLNNQSKHQPQMYSQGMPYNEGVGVYQPLQQPLQFSQPPPTQQTLQFSHMQDTGVLDHSYAPQAVYQMPPYQQQVQQQTPTMIHSTTSQSPDARSQDEYSNPQDLAELLGDLKMDAGGRAPYLNSKMKNRSTEEPATEDLDAYKDNLPPVSLGPDLKIRIPPELMPDEETCLQYFELYFANVHPYVPVLNKSLFYQQWHNNRDAMSPLLLEAVFSIAGKLADEPSQGQQWLALAGKHVDAFMDVPRLSTLQALLIILKARESAPKKGYYYRSWMTVVQCVAMGKDLGLDEHFDDHKNGRSCGLSSAECITKTRIWQAIFVCELMIGSPQDRTDMAVEIDSIDLSVPRPVPGEDSTEYDVTRNFNYFTRIVRNVRRMNDVYGRIKKKKEWGMDPELTQLNPSFESWMRDLPSDLQISFPPDISPPWLPNHFIGNLHSYYYLSIIMLHRPQLQFLDAGSGDGQWKTHMVICYDAAKRLCRIQEAIIQYNGLPGLLCMQRGVNFTIYAILTCIVLHLVAITSPDPDINADAREFFARHMRILEKCTTAWPMPDMQQQIDSLREAFSADTRKPFELKGTFPYGSPGGSMHSSPPPVPHYQQPQMVRAPIDIPHLKQHNAQQSQLNYTTHPITPPISAGALDSKRDSPAVQSLVMMSGGQRVQQQPMTSSVPLVDPVQQWNPSRIFDQWNTSFGTPRAAPPQAPQPYLKLDATQSGSPEINQMPGLPQDQQNANLPMPAGSQGQAMTVQQYAAPLPSFVSPSMWQESVASVYEGGLKRQWDYDGQGMVNSSYKRAR